MRTLAEPVYQELQANRTREVFLELLQHVLRRTLPTTDTTAGGFCLQLIAALARASRLCP